ncbi:MAG TPA: hypothetical protein VIY96_10825, partial [Thermoanaerobaculia bacterium]
MIAEQNRTRSRAPASAFAAAAAALLFAMAARGAAQETPAAPALRPFFGQTVVSVGYTTDGPVDKDEVARLVSI